MSTSPDTVLPGATQAFPADMDLVVRGRNPLRLADSTIQTAMQIPIPAPRASADGRGDIDASILIVTHNNEALTRLCIGALSRTHARPTYL